jgi:hypothetical protein
MHIDNKEDLKTFIELTALRSFVRDVAGVSQFDQLIDEARDLANSAEAPLNISDHALVLQAIIHGVARWEWFTGSAGKAGELCFGGMRYCADLDPFGLPKLYPHARNALRKRMEVA